MFTDFLQFAPNVAYTTNLFMHLWSDWLEMSKTVISLNIAGNFSICCRYSIQGEWRVKKEIRFCNSPLKNAFLLSPQTERAYQKQPTIFQNKKRVLATDGGKEVKEKLPRYHKSVGLGFKTPREVKWNWTTSQLISQKAARDVLSHDGLLSPRGFEDNAFWHYWCTWEAHVLH